MPIPPLDANGLLPPGIHDATLDELEEAFGGPGAGSRRRALMKSLRSYLAEVKQWRMMEELLIDGSFVTDKPDPDDIDLLLVLPVGYELTRVVSPYEYNLRSHRMIRKRFGFDLFAVRSNSADYDRFVQHFSQVRERPGLRKGIIRVRT